MTALSDLFRRSKFGTGWWVVKDDEAAMGVVVELIDAGACSVAHGGMFDDTTRAIAIPGGCLYEVVSSYGFFGPQPKTWIFGPTALRQVLRLLDGDQPRRRLSGENTIPTIADLTTDWDRFIHQDTLTKVGASLGALAWMRYGGRAKDPEQFHPIPLPITATWDSRPADVVHPMDPRLADTMFWTAQTTTVDTSKGRFSLNATGTMEPVQQN